MNHEYILEYEIANKTICIELDKYDLIEELKKIVNQEVASEIQLYFDKDNDEALNEILYETFENYYEELLLMHNQEAQDSFAESFNPYNFYGISKSDFYN